MLGSNSEAGRAVRTIVEIYRINIIVGQLGSRMELEQTWRKPLVGFHTTDAVVSNWGVCVDGGAALLRETGRKSSFTELRCDWMSLRCQRDGQKEMTTTLLETWFATEGRDRGQSVDLGNNSTDVVTAAY